MVNFKELTDKMGYEFKDTGLLNQALTHSSYVNEKGQDKHSSNERLEFLGDALLEMIISRVLYHKKPTLSEGEMTKLRAEVVCEKSLCQCALDINLGSFLQLGRGEASSGGRTRPSMLADAFEALIAAIYLDGGLQSATQFVERTFSPQIHRPKKADLDYKSLLQEYIQDKHGMTLSYRIISQEGPAHDCIFTSEVLINSLSKGIGKGKTKKSAEQAAAKEALEQLQK